MKRDAALASLSRDHHQALVVAVKLRRASASTADDARAALAAYWPVHGREHFRLEEEVVLPAYAGHGDPHHPLIARALCDHVAIRHRAAVVLGDSDSTLADLHELGGLIAAHVRLEERALFPLIERAMPLEQLSALAAALEQAESVLADE
jgi:hemerythrin-like domain-containing protein